MEKVPLENVTTPEQDAVTEDGNVSIQPEREDVLREQENLENVVTEPKNIKENVTTQETEQEKISDHSDLDDLLIKTKEVISPNIPELENIIGENDSSISEEELDNLIQQQEAEIAELERAMTEPNEDLITEKDSCEVVKEGEKSDTTTQQKPESNISNQKDISTEKENIIEPEDVSTEQEKVKRTGKDKKTRKKDLKKRSSMEEDGVIIEPDNASDSDMGTTSKKMKSTSSQALLDLLECDDPENFPYDFPIPDLDESIIKDPIKLNSDSKNEKNTDKPVFMHIDTEKEDQDKLTNPGEQDEVAVDPIGESSSEWAQEDTECIVPDTNQTREERDSIRKRNSSDNGEQSTSSDQAVEVVDTVENPEWEGKHVVNIFNGDEPKACMICDKEEVPKYRCTLNKNETFICSEPCLKQLKEQHVENVIVRDLRVKNFAPPPDVASTLDTETDNFRKCAGCGQALASTEFFISWESLEFCENDCIKNYQKKIGSHCAACEQEVPEICLGKYCVRFGFNIRQFCSGTCLIKYKKGLKVCSYCRENIDDTKEGVPSDIKLKARDFCSEKCKNNYIILKDGRKLAGPCAVCHKEKLVEIEFSDGLKGAIFCSEPCFVAFKYVNNIVPDKCSMCLKYYSKKDLSLYMINDRGVILRYCSKTCQNVYINIYRKIVSCCWCKVKKYNFDMIQRIDGRQRVMWCSLNCYRLYESNRAPAIGKRRCAVCHKSGNMIYHITSDVGLKSFCSYKCVRDHQTKQTPTLRVADINSVPTIIKRVTRKSLGAGRKQIIPDTPAPLPIITSVRSLAPEKNVTRSTSPDVEKPTKYIVMVRPPDLPDIRNVSTAAKPLMVNEESHIKPVMIDKETQTDIFNPTDMEVIPVPIYIPQPIHMFNFTYIKPMSFPLPIPVPILMAMTKTGTSGILKEVKTAQPTPSDPYEADLLVMAQLVADANDKDADEEQAPESEPDDTVADDPSFSPEPPEQNTSFGDDVLQMALHMATDFTEPAVDLEGALTANTITATTSNDQVEVATPTRPERATRGTRRRGRSSRGGRGRGRGRPSTQEPVPVPEPTPEPPPEPTEKPDANMCLKYTFGVNAWKQWVTNKNNELEKSSRRVKLFKTDLLQLTSDELNYSLCLFIKEVRKPNGAEYAPDTIYYLCLGVQQYLFENGRIDNIFCDPYYETFTDCLDDICKKFSTLYNDSQYIVTRVEEEHLWESKQLGAHSPHVLLSTLMFFNTKHFNLTNVEEHMQLSFSHIMKHWKRVPNTPGTSKNTTSRNILLRFYPPQSSVDGNRKKKVYEQQENEENPIRCPVKLYEFYLSKCPESVKTRNDVFYLQPERSCVPDSPVWYSTMALGKESLEKMLHRVKMVKEINVALLSS